MRGTTAIYTVIEQTSHCGNLLCDSKNLTKAPPRVQGTFGKRYETALNIGLLKSMKSSDRQNQRDLREFG